MRARVRRVRRPRPCRRPKGDLAPAGKNPSRQSPALRGDSVATRARLGGEARRRAHAPDSARLRLCGKLTDRPAGHRVEAGPQEPSFRPRRPRRRPGQTARGRRRPAVPRRRRQTARRAASRRVPRITVRSVRMSRPFRTSREVLPPHLCPLATPPATHARRADCALLRRSVRERRGTGRSGQSPTKRRDRREGTRARRDLPPEANNRQAGAASWPPAPVQQRRDIGVMRCRAQDLAAGHRPDPPAIEIINSAAMPPAVAMRRPLRGRRSRYADGAVSPPDLARM